MGTVTTLPSGGRKLVRDYRGSKIWLTESYQFEVEGEGFAGYESKTFGSLKDAEAKIDANLAAAARSTRERVSLRVLNNVGLPETITGIHGKTGDVLGVGKFRDFYPDVAWLAEVLAEKKRLNERLNEINKTISPYRIRQSFSVHGSDSRHAQAIAELKAMHEKATERAEVAAKAGITLASDHKA